jgi:general secretion pathway protein D
LFTNVGIGRQTQSLMLMVTPRIIIQEEEEQRLGLTAP